MKILAFTDTHTDSHAMAKIKQKAEKADLLICCGDFTVFGDGLKEALKQMNSMGKKVLLVHGNHESLDRVKTECEKYSNLVFLHKKFYEEDGFVFCGYGGGGFAQEDDEFESFAEKIAAKMSGKKEGALIMIFHMPPYGCALDNLPMGHVGSISYTEFIKQQKPALTLSGHIEENNGRKDVIGKTLVMNPGPDGRAIEITRKEKQKK